MKKLTTLLAAAVVGLVLGSSSCKKQASSPSSPSAQLLMYYLGAVRDYSAETIVSLDADSGYLLLSGDQWGTINIINIRAKGLTTGNYPVTETSANYIKLLKGYSKYSTQAPGGWGNISVSKLDTSWVSGTFNGTLVNITDSHDSFNISRGTFNLKPQN